MEQFLAAHDPQLKSINFPMCLANELYQKSKQDSVNDVRNTFEIRTCENSRSMLIAKEDFDVNSCLYLVDHIWTNDGGKLAYDKLKKSPELVERLASMFHIPPPIEPEVSFDLSKQVDVISSLSKSTKDAAEKELEDCESDTVAALMKLLNVENTEVEQEAKPKKKKDRCSFAEFTHALKSAGQISGNENEDYLKKMYENYLEGGDGCGNTSQYNWSDDGSTVTVLVSIPGTVKKNSVKSTLGIKSWKLVINDKELINGELSATVKPDECYWVIESPGVLCMTLEKVVCLNLWSELIKGEVLLSPDMIISTSWLKETSTSLYLKEILDAMWSYNQVYVFMSTDGIKKNPVWYIMDEYGSALTHGTDPNFQCSPFFNIHNGRTYSLFWPITNVTKGCVCTRNFIPQIMQQETHETYKARMKAFIGDKIYQDVEIAVPFDKPEVVEDKVEVLDLTGENMIVSDECNIEKSIYLSVYNSDVPNDIYTKLKLNVTTNNEAHVDISILPLSDTSIMIDGDVLPTCEMIANTDYLQNYLKFQFNDCNWFSMSYILPCELEHFCKEFESSNLCSFWIIKQVDKRMSDVNIVVSSSYARIVRMCEAGSISVSKYIVDQPRFRHRRFALNYSVILCLSDNGIFVHKEPLVRQTKEQYNPNAFIDEYNTSSDITEMPERLVGNQDAETYNDFKTAMNKLLLPVNPERGWDVYQNTIFQNIGVMSKAFLKDLVIKRLGKCFVMFGVDVIMDSNLTPIIIDVNGVSNLPNKSSLINILGLGNGNFTKDFVQIV